MLPKQRPYYPKYSVILHLRGCSLVPFNLVQRRTTEKWVYGHMVPSVL